MVKIKYFIFVLLSLFFLLFSFYPTIYELQKGQNLTDKNREFILEHNYYWPDFNLYLSKIRQGYEGRWTVLERYTSEPHTGSLIQIFYVVLGQIGRIFRLDPNYAYQLTRVILSPLLLLILILLVKYFFADYKWQIIAFLITLTSGSFPRFYTDHNATLQVGRFMEWWSNIDAVQRLTFIPHIVFGQVVSLFLLYHLTLNIEHLTSKKLIGYIILGNLVGLVFPPSLMTLNGVLLLLIFVMVFAHIRKKVEINHSFHSLIEYIRSNRIVKCYLLYVIFSLPSLLYLLVTTKYIPWSSLVDFHRTHPMMIPFDQYILGTGPIFILGLLGTIISVIKRERRFQPLIFWLIATFGFAAVFSAIKEQSPLRFTQTGLFIPLGILGTYFFQQFLNFTTGDASGGLPIRAAANPPADGWSEHEVGVTRGRTRKLQLIVMVLIALYILGSLFMMQRSLAWQTTFISQRVGAWIPPVPYPPQTMYPLRNWMDGIRWIRDNTNREDVILAEFTAGNFIPAYSGNTVYWGQSNTVAYERKQRQVDSFFNGITSAPQAELLMKNGKIKYIFVSVQENDKLQDKKIEAIYPFLKPVYSNATVTIYQVEII